MLQILTNSFDRPLQPMERLSEILFGLIMALTFTCSVSVADAGRAEIRTVVLGAVGCNVAWGIIDAVFYLMHCFGTQGRGIVTLQRLRHASSPAQVQEIVAQALPPVLVSVLSPSDFELMRHKLNRLVDLPPRPRLKKKDWVGALGVFLSVVLATLPVVIPFVLIADIKAALRVSNGVAVLMLFLSGYGFGKYAGHRPWTMAVVMIALGLAMVATTISLGG